jgi:hypothetical protein
MPEVLPTGNSVSFGGNAVLQKPALAAQGLNVCANWALIEKDLMELYSLLMGTYLITFPGFEPPNHPVAYQVFDTLNNLQARLDLLLALAKWRAGKDAAEKLELDIIPKLRNRFAERSAIAHGVWGICGKYPDALILMRTFDGHLIYREHDFKQASQRILEMDDRVKDEIISPLRKRLREERDQAAKATTTLIRTIVPPEK